MTMEPRPMLLGYVRAGVLRRAVDLRRVLADLDAFAVGEDFSLGTVFVDGGDTPGAFPALIEELTRNDAARGIVIPDRRHLTCDEQIALSRHEQASRMPVLFVNSAPLAGGPGAGSPSAPGSPFMCIDR